MATKDNKTPTSSSSSTELNAALEVTRYNIIYITSTVLGVVMLGLFLFWIMKYRNGFGWTNNPSEQFNWHPFCMYAWFFCFSQAILMFRTGRDLKKRTLKYIHGAFHTISFIFVAIGLAAIVSSKNIQGYEHLFSLHSWVGLLTIISYGIQCLVGFGSFIFPRVPLQYKNCVLGFHVPFGVICFCAAVVTTYGGLIQTAIFKLGHTYGSLPAEGIIMNLIGLFHVIYGMLTLYLIFEPQYQREPYYL